MGIVFLFMVWAARYAPAPVPAPASAGEHTATQDLIQLSSPPASFWDDPRFDKKPLPNAVHAAGTGEVGDIQLDPDFVASQLDDRE